MSEVLLPELSWVGPYRLYQDVPQVDDINPTLVGVYLWVIPIAARFFPHYVGEAGNLRNRLLAHRANLTGGSYWIYDPGELKAGRLTPVYNPNEDSRVFDGVWDKAKDFARLLRFFILAFPPDPQVNTKRLRLRVELGLARAIGAHFKSQPDEPQVWDQSCAPTHERNKRLEEEPEVQVRFVVPEFLVGVDGSLTV